MEEDCVNVKRVVGADGKYWEDAIQSEQLGLMASEGDQRSHLLFGQTSCDEKWNLISKVAFQNLRWD